MPKISVIIPVYNLENYISKCIDSILESSEQDFEILLINDGSTDKSGEICEHLALQDTRIKVFHKENGGVSSARNLGIENASGEWVVFIDGDDLVEPNFLTIPADLGLCDVIQKPRICRKNEDPKTDTLCFAYDMVINGQDKITKFFIRNGNLEITEKIFNRIVIQDDRFAENIPIGEDGLFFYTILNKINNWGFSSDGKYIYQVRSSSAMNTTQIHQRISIWFDLCGVAYDIAKNKNTLKLYQNYIADKYIPAICSQWHMLTPTQKSRLNSIFQQVNISKLTFLSFKHFIKYILLYIKFHLIRKK